MYASSKPGVASDPTGPQRTISRVLVANRGEIALRVMASCRALGIATVAVFSEADRGSLHVKRADRASRLGRDVSVYSDIEALVACARRHGADAVHPGYGFASEDPAFAAACAAADLLFIGPGEEVLRSLGDKVQAREVAEEVGIPVVPGARFATEEAAAQLGYPVMLKAHAGRAGRGLQVVETPEAFEDALLNLQIRAIDAYDDDRVYLEKFIDGARHIEVQILGDIEGNIVHLGERECSVQRRYQKFIEEAPAPGLSRSTREALGEAAVAIGEWAGYTSAGTVEFLVKDEAFYFLGINSRIQAEHAVTEAILGVDLVEQQLRIARGEIAPWEERLKPRVALECRVYAQDVSNASTIAAMHIPDDEWLRVESAVEVGSPVGRENDPFLMTLVTVGTDRDLARARMRTSLRDLVVLGVATNIQHLQAVLAAPSFAAGQPTTGQFAQPPRRGGVPDAAFAAAGLALDGRAGADPNDSTPPGQTQRWDGGARVDTRPLRGDIWEVGINGVREEWRRVQRAPYIWIEDKDGDQHRFHVLTVGKDVWVHGEGRTHCLRPEPSVAQDNRATVGVCTSPVAGRLIEMGVDLGQKVVSGQTLATVLSNHGEHALRAPCGGEVLEIYARVGRAVTAGGVIMVLGDSGPTSSL